MVTRPGRVATAAARGDLDLSLMNAKLVVVATWNDSPESGDQAMCYLSISSVNARLRRTVC